MNEYERLAQKLRGALDEMLASENIAEILDEFRTAGFSLGKATLTLTIGNRPLPVEIVPTPASVDWLDRLLKLEDPRER